MEKPTDPRGRVNGAAAQGKFTFLSGEICPCGGSVRYGSLTEAQVERPGTATGPYGMPAARRSEMTGVNGQKSAEAIVAAPSVIGGT